MFILLPSYKISSEGVITPHHNTNNRPHEMIIISQNIALRFVDFNNTRLDDAKICTDYGETATFNGSHFRRADMNRVTFGSPSHSSDDWIIPSGCLHIRNEFRLMETCISLENTKFSQAILDNSFIHASVAGASMAGISVGGVNWDNTLWHDTIWVNSDVITGRGNPKNWDRYSS